MINILTGRCDEHHVDELAAENEALRAQIDRLQAALEGLHFHHKMFEPYCRHCNEALVGKKL